MWDWQATKDDPLCVCALKFDVFKIKAVHSTEIKAVHSTESTFTAKIRLRVTWIERGLSKETLQAISNARVHDEWARLLDLALWYPKLAFLNQNDEGDASSQRVSKRQMLAQSSHLTTSSAIQTWSSSIHTRRGQSLTVGSTCDGSHLTCRSSISQSLRSHTGGAC